MKKTFLVGMSLALTLGAFQFSAVSPAAQADTHQDKHHGGAPFDLAVANDEKLIEMLKKSGKISADASPAEAEKVLNQFLKQKASFTTKDDGELSAKEQKALGILKDKALKNGLTNGKGNKLGQTKNTVDPAKEEKYNGGVRKDNVLVLLVEYPDFPHNNIKSSETDMYYPDYTKEHYEEMIFGENGYKGPNGENLVSVKQFYEQQSGGSYTIEGTVAGWYKASQPAAYYGGNVGASENDARPRTLVYEALKAAAADPNVNLAEFDQEDRYDLDGDGNTREPDGIIDHLMVVHSSVGEEAGGGSLGGDAIWSHRWNLGGVATLPGTTTDVPYWGGKLAAYDYTIEPADGAAGVFAHEYGHDLGLPDEYDTQYTGAGEAVSYWSIMASGSWAGTMPGTEPTGFSPWAKEFLHGSMGGNWLTGTTVDSKDVTSKGIELLLDQANTKGNNNDAVRVNLPLKETVINKPTSGQYEYFGGKSVNSEHAMVTSLDLTDASSAALNFKAWYEIEKDWDYASVQVKEEGSSNWVSILGNITTTEDPNHQNPGYGITGHSNGWVDAGFDLSAYAGKKIDVAIKYWTDPYVNEAGIYVDDISISVDGSTVLSDNAEGESKFNLEGFTKDNGIVLSEHYYLLEWRNHQGVDKGLAHIARAKSLMSYDAGLIVWYVDNAFEDNWTGIHPGDGFLGVVDADQSGLVWSDKTIGSTRYQVHDAAFSLVAGQKMSLDYSHLGFTMKDNQTSINPLFDDSINYANATLPDAGRNVPKYGLKFRVTGESADRTAAKVLIYK